MAIDLAEKLADGMGGAGDDQETVVVGGLESSSDVHLHDNYLEFDLLI